MAEHTLNTESVENIRRQYNEQRYTANPQHQTIHRRNWKENNYAFLAKTDTAGVGGRTHDAAAATDTLGTGTARLYWVDQTGLLLDSGTDIDCYNMATSAVAADTFVQLKLVAGVYMVDVEDCG